MNTRKGFVLALALAVLLWVAAPTSSVVAGQGGGTGTNGGQGTAGASGQGQTTGGHKLPVPGAMGFMQTGTEKSGALEVLDKDGKAVAACPLKHTDVAAEVSGFLARVNVTQEFTNPSPDKIEAVYVFPLPDESAVDDMTMKVGERNVKGIIRKREEAQQIYQQAKAAGHVASLLEQERPNIFTQSVANIEPGATVLITISYVEVLKYEAGSYEFSFPMVVGPRYIPGEPTGQQAGGWAPDTTRVPDASRITPPVAGVHTPAERAGHDISLSVKLDAGVPIQEASSETHDVDVDRTGASTMNISLRDKATIPNRDFILKYDVAGGRIEDALLTHSRGAAAGKTLGMPGPQTDGYFTFILQPPDKVSGDDITPREIIFVIDTSGSQYGFPLEKSKKLADLALDHLNPRDTFNIITFAGNTQVLFPEPVNPTAENLARARSLLSNLTGGGGTEMMKAIRAALDPSDSQKHVRIAVFMTDGYVGNDMEIIGEVQKHQNARVFTLGIGNSVNRFLLDKMAEYGRGEVEVVTLEKQADPAVDRLFERVRTPLLTDVEIDWNGLPVTDVYPTRLPDLFRAKPVVVTGRYTGAARGTIHLRGKRAGDDFERDIAVNLPASESEHDVLATLWARQRIDHLMAQDWEGMQRGAPMKDLKDQITELGLNYKLMTQFTSFVAVEEKTVTKGGQPVTIQVPVEMPAGVSRTGVFGEEKDEMHAQNIAVNGRALNSLAKMSPGYVGGAGGGVGGGVAPGTAYSQPAAVPSPKSRTETVEVTASSPEVSQGREGNRKEDRNKLADKDLGKMDASVRAAYNCWLALPVGSRAANANCPGATAGRIKLMLTLADGSDATLRKLKAAGFTVDATSGASVLGSIVLEKLAALAELDAVKNITAAPGVRAGR